MKKSEIYPRTNAKIYKCKPVSSSTLFFADLSLVNFPYLKSCTATFKKLK